MPSPRRYRLLQLLLLNSYYIGRSVACGVDHEELHRERRRNLQQRQRQRAQRKLEEATEEPYNPRLLFYGNLRDDLGLPVKDAKVQFWHADYHGNYFHPEDPLDGNELLKESFSYFGTATTDADGDFDFQTYRPGIYVARPVTHIHFKVFYEGEELLSSQFYFEDEGVARWYDPTVILSLEEDVDEDGNVVLSTFKQIVVDMGTGGYQKRTPWDVEGPFYPLVDFFDVGSNMTSGLLRKFYTNTTLSPTSEPTRKPTRKPTRAPSQRPSSRPSEEVVSDLDDAVDDILVDLGGPNGDDGNYTWNLDDEEALIVDFQETLDDYDGENFTSSIHSNDDDDVKNEKVTKDDIEEENGKDDHEYSDEEDDVDDNDKATLFSPEDEFSSIFRNISNDSLELPLTPEDVAFYDKLRLTIKDRLPKGVEDEEQAHKPSPGVTIHRGVNKKRNEEQNSCDEDCEGTVEGLDSPLSDGKRFLRNSK